MAQNSVVPERHSWRQHTYDERCFATHVACSDNTCASYQKHYVCPVHNFHPGDRVTDWEHNNRHGYIVGVSPLGVKRALYVKFDNEPKIRAIFGRCVCGDLYHYGQPRDNTKIDTELATTRIE